MIQFAHYRYEFEQYKYQQCQQQIIELKQLQASNSRISISWLQYRLQYTYEQPAFATQNQQSSHTQKAQPAYYNLYLPYKYQFQIIKPLPDTFQNSEEFGQSNYQLDVYGFVHNYNFLYLYLYLEWLIQGDFFVYFGFKFGDQYGYSVIQITFGIEVSRLYERLRQWSKWLPCRKYSNPLGIHYNPIQTSYPSNIYPTPNIVQDWSTQHLQNSTNSPYYIINLIQTNNNTGSQPQIYLMNRLARVGIKYLTETDLYRSLGSEERMEYIFGKFKEPRTQEYFLRKFPEYPKKDIWRKGGYDLQTYSWQSQSNYPKAVLINFNALNAHTGLSGDMGHKFAEAGYVVAGYDYPNFGRSGGKERGHIQSIEQILYLSQQFVQNTRKKYQGIPIFIGGISLGGLISFQLGLKEPKGVNGCFFVNPALQDNPANLPKIKKLIKRFGHLYPKLLLTKPVSTNSTTYSLDKYKLYDPYLYTGRLWTSTSMHILKAMDKTPPKYKQFRLPYICIQGGTDKVVNPFAVYDFQRDSVSIDKQTVFIDKLWHSLWFDDHLEEVLELLKNWTDKRVK